MSNEIKVTDKRIFTASGELKEEFRHLEEAEAEVLAAGVESADQEPPQPPRSPGPTTEPSPPPAQSPQSAERVQQKAGPTTTPPGGEPERPLLEIPGTPPEMGAPTFYDLVGMLAEPAAVYLGDAPLPNGESVEDLDAARLYIDLLDVLRDKTRGNVTSQESTVLEDVLYRLRIRYVSKRG